MIAVPKGAVLYIHHLPTVLQTVGNIYFAHFMGNELMFYEQISIRDDCAKGLNTTQHNNRMSTKCHKAM